MSRSTKVRSAVALSFAARVISAITSLTSSMVIARLLMPAELGIYAIGLTLMLLLEALREFGVDRYLVQEQYLTHNKIRAAFSITLLLAWCAGGCLLLVSGPVATYYSAPALASVVSVLAISFFFLPFGAPALSLLRREIRFDTLLRINAVANITTTIVSITLAEMGFGAVSMAWGVAAGAAAVTIGASAAKPSYALIRPTLHGWRPVLTFGAQFTFASVIVQLAESAMLLLIGRMLGLNALGIFSRAYSLVVNARTSIFGSLANVAFPVLAARIRDGCDIREPYLRACGLLTGIIWPIQGFLVLMAFPIFRVLFGPRWDTAIPLFQLLVFGDAAFEALAFALPVLLAFGRVDYFVRSEVVVQAARLILTLPATLLGLEAVCVAEVLHYGFFLAVFGRKLRLLMGLAFSSLAKVYSKSILLTLFSLVGPGLSAMAFGSAPESPWLPLMVAGVGGSMGWLLGVFLLNHNLRWEIGRVTIWLRGLLVE
jgi:O-antigen/teichoic acid export membrane protein